MRKGLKPDDVVCVLALDKRTGYSVTSTSCDAKDTAHYASYYNSIGYHTRTLTYDELNEFLESEKSERLRQQRMSQV